MDNTTQAETPSSSPSNHGVVAFIRALVSLSKVVDKDGDLMRFAQRFLDGEVDDQVPSFSITIDGSNDNGAPDSKAGQLTEADVDRLMLPPATPSSQQRTCDSRPREETPASPTAAVVKRRRTSQDDKDDLDANKAGDVDEKK